MVNIAENVIYCEFFLLIGSVVATSSLTSVEPQINPSEKIKSSEEEEDGEEEQDDDDGGDEGDHEASDERGEFLKFASQNRIIMK